MGRGEVELVSRFKTACANEAARREGYQIYICTYVYANPPSEHLNLFTYGESDLDKVEN